MFENITCHHKKTTKCKKPLKSNAQIIKDVGLFAIAVILCLLFYYMGYSKQNSLQQYLGKSNKECNCANKAIVTGNK